MIVVDSSVAFKWLVEEEDSNLATDLLGGDLIAPDLVLAECGNALWKQLKRGQIDEGHALSSLASLPGFLKLIPAADYTLRAFTIASGLGHPIYDCYFLALAEALDCPLVTADSRLIVRCAPTSFAKLVRPLA